MKASEIDAALVPCSHWLHQPAALHFASHNQMGELQWAAATTARLWKNWIVPVDNVISLLRPLELLFFLPLPAYNNSARI